MKRERERKKEKKGKIQKERRVKEEELFVENLSLLLDGAHVFSSIPCTALNLTHSTCSYNTERTN